MSKKDPSATPPPVSYRGRTSGPPTSRQRARLTTNPMAVRANSNTARGRRLRDLFWAFMSDHDPNDVIVQSAALRCAELVATSEDIRAEMRDEKTTIADRLKLAEALVRVENLATRAQKQLAALLVERRPKASDWWRPYDGKPAEQDDDEGDNQTDH